MNTWLGLLLSSVTASALAMSWIAPAPETELVEVSLDCDGCGVEEPVVLAPQGWTSVVSFDGSFQGFCDCLPNSPEDPTLVCQQERAPCTARLTILITGGFDDWFVMDGDKVEDPNNPGQMINRAREVGPNGHAFFPLTETEILEFSCGSGEMLSPIQFYPSQQDAESGTNETGQIIVSWECKACQGSCTAPVE